MNGWYGSLKDIKIYRKFSVVVFNWIEMRLLRDHRFLFAVGRFFHHVFFGFIRCPQNQLYVFCFSRIISNVCEALLSSTSARSTSLVFLFSHFVLPLFHPLFSPRLLFVIPICLFVYSFLSSYFVTFLYLILFVVVVVVIVCNLAFYIFLDEVYECKAKASVKKYVARRFIKWDVGNLQETGTLQFSHCFDLLIH